MVVARIPPYPYHLFDSKSNLHNIPSSHDSTGGMRIFDFRAVVGVQIVERALTTPALTIANNAGVNGSVVVEKILASKGNMGYDALNDQYVDMLEAGIIDPTKVCSLP